MGGVLRCFTVVAVLGEKTSSSLYSRRIGDMEWGRSNCCFKLVISSTFAGSVMSNSVSCEHFTFHNSLTCSIALSKSALRMLISSCKISFVLLGSTSAFLTSSTYYLRHCIHLHQIDAHLQIPLDVPSETLHPHLSD